MDFITLAEVCPLTALKFAELSVRAGIPPGVINIVTGKGKHLTSDRSQHYQLSNFVLQEVLSVKL